MMKHLLLKYKNVMAKCRTRAQVTSHTHTYTHPHTPTPTHPPKIPGCLFYRFFDNSPEIEISMIIKHSKTPPPLPHTDKDTP